MFKTPSSKNCSSRPGVATTTLQPLLVVSDEIWLFLHKCNKSSDQFRSSTNWLQSGFVQRAPSLGTK
ncbi:unnamed protein product [Allacma fusca]|uniref:Uncharacterized protein n=1 Tax=Allacma fusca TaxID=39272 RepID=A0A8J2PFN7_9HEXA|nr:unnamed protein product [Allacma fusca]